jgi:outer membrane protein assembly factor BamA
LKALPLRLEYGFPILTQWDHLDGSNGRFHFNIGWSF